MASCTSYDLHTSACIRTEFIAVCNKNSPPLPFAEERDSEVSECQVFAATQEETAVDGVSSGSRDLPVSQAETLGATEPRYDKHSKKKPLPPIAEESPTTFTATLTQESGQTHMVPSTHQRLGTRSSEESIVAALEVANKSLDIVEQQSKERQSMKASNDKKDEKIMLLLERNNKAMCQLVNKDAQIKALQKDSHYTRDRLDLEHSECERLKNDLEERRVKISKLEQDIRQHGKERGQVRDKKEKLEEVETNFKQARRELAKEKKMRNEMGEKLTDTEKRIQDLERCVQRVDTEVKETEGEREYYSDIVQWTKVDVEDEDEDEDVIAFKINKLKTKVRVYKTAFIAVLVILMLLVLSRIPFTCALLFGQDDEL